MYELIIALALVAPPDEPVFALANAALAWSNAAVTVALEPAAFAEVKAAFANAYIFTPLTKTVLADT